MCTHTSEISRVTYTFYWYVDNKDYPKKEHSGNHAKYDELISAEQSWFTSLASV